MYSYIAGLESRIHRPKMRIMFGTLKTIREMYLSAKYTWTIQLNGSIKQLILIQSEVRRFLQLRRFKKLKNAA